MYRRNRMNQKGAASMLSVAIFAIIVTVVVTAYFRSAMNQQADSNTYDFSTRAYYAAESGVQDAIRAVNADPSFATKDTCDGFVPATADGGVLNDHLGLRYTCQLINKTPSSISFTVNEAENVMVRLLPAQVVNGEYQVVVRWSRNDSSNNFVAREIESTHFPAQADWRERDSGIHPALRTSFITYSNSNPATGASQRVLFLNPLSANYSQGTVELNDGDSEGVRQEQLVQPARCYDTGPDNSYDGYLCEQVVTMTGYPLDANVLIARVRALYGSTEVQISLQQNGQSIPIRDGAVEIDVTGTAGTAFRRVRQLYHLQDGVMRDTLPEAAVIGGDGICKYYSITDDPADFDNKGSCFTP